MGCCSYLFLPYWRRVPHCSWQHQETINAAIIVDSITKEWLGVIGGFLAILGVIALPSPPKTQLSVLPVLILADFLKIDQKPMIKRLLISVPLFFGSFLLMQVDFSIILAIFCLDESNAGCFHIVGLNRLVGSSRKLYMITLLSTLFIDCCLHYLYLYRSWRFQTFSATLSQL